jgi:organic hydroperoxide reductase OsmC/OhrA
MLSSLPGGRMRSDSVAAAVDPEEAFVASLSSCHMLFFRSFAARARLTVDRYEDEAMGEMAKNEAGRMFVAKVTLRPRITISGDKRPSEAELAALHHTSHAACFIANSVETEVVTERLPPVFA